MNSTKLPTYFLNHGAGPWPWLAENVMPMNFIELGDSLRSIPNELAETPKAILIISGHWEEPEFTVQTTPNPPMIYDYYGFPAHTYEVQYPVKGEAQVAARVMELLSEAGIANRSDNTRGIDHGVYVPLSVAFPDADVPVVQMSIRDGFDPAEHLAAGQALAPLRDENVLILGSGVPSYHNMGLRNVPVESRGFDDWLTETMVDASAEERLHRMLAWDQAPYARVAHPREDHFMPGFVALGAAADDIGYRNYHEDSVMGWMFSSGYRFGLGTAA